MGDTSETNTKVLSRELFLGVVALKRLYRKIIICAIRSLFPNPVTYGQISCISGYENINEHFHICVSMCTSMNINLHACIHTYIHTYIHIHSYIPYSGEY